MASAIFWGRARPRAQNPLRLASESQNQRVGSMARSAASSAGGRARDFMRRAATPASTSPVFCDEEGHFGSFPWLEMVHRAAEGRNTRQGDEPHRRHADARRARARWLCRAAARPCRAERYGRLLRGAYRAGRDTGKTRSCASVSSRRSWRSGNMPSKVTGEQNHAGTPR